MNNSTESSWNKVAVLFYGWYYHSNSRCLGDLDWSGQSVPKGVLGYPYEWSFTSLWHCIYACMIQIICFMIFQWIPSLLQLMNLIFVIFFLVRMWSILSNLWECILSDLSSTTFICLYGFDISMLLCIEALDSLLSFHLSVHFLPNLSIILEIITVNFPLHTSHTPYSPTTLHYQWISFHILSLARIPQIQTQYSNWTNFQLACDQPDGTM